MKVHLYLQKKILIETDRGKELLSKISTDFLSINNIQSCSRYTSLGAVFAESFNLSRRNLLKRLVFEKGDGNWVDILLTITKPYKNRFHSSTKLTPIEASLTKNEGGVYINFLDKRKKIEPKCRVADLVKTADSKRTS